MLEAKPADNRPKDAGERLETLIFDSHAHYDDEAFDEDRNTLLSSFQKNGIGYVVNVTASLDSVEKTLALTEKYDFIYGSMGIHPNETMDLTEEKLKELEGFCHREKIVAVGEIGLDYYWDEPERPMQKKWFMAQLEIAERTGLPVIIHSREAAKDTLDIMKECHGRLHGGIIHCFSYGVELAREYLSMGYYLGIGGVLTFKNSKKLKEVAEYAPLNRIVLETDCPYLAPVPFRGKRNDSTRLPYVVEALSEIKGISAEEIMRTTTRNAMDVYRINAE